MSKSQEKRKIKSDLDSGHLKKTKTEETSLNAGSIDHEQEYQDEDSDSNEMDSELDSNSSDDQGSVDNMEIDVEFEAYLPAEEDLPGITKLLDQMFLNEVNVDGISRLIVEMDTMSLIIKQSLAEDVSDQEKEKDSKMDQEKDKAVLDSVFSVNAAINLDIENDSVKEVKKYLIKKSKEAGQDKMKSILEKSDSNVALIINERFINLPATLAIPCFDDLINDMKETNEAKKFEWFVVIIKLLVPTESRPEHREVIIQNQEEEYFDEVADMKFEFKVQQKQEAHIRSVGGSSSKAEDFLPYRRVMILNKNAWFNAVNKLKEELKWFE